MPNITIPAENSKSFNGYISTPKITPAPCVIVIQEIFGINQGLREKCDWLADEGFIACAPDLFWRIEHGIELSDHIPEELDRAFELFSLFNIEQGLKDIKATHRILKDHSQSTGKVGCLGYCLGGKLAYLTACHSDIDASIGYYGVGIEELLADANNMTTPTMLHAAGKDEFVSKDAQEKINNALLHNDKITLHSYPNRQHAFTRINGLNYHEVDADIADKRSINFLKTNLA